MHGELDTYGYHVVNVCLHTAATLLFVRLARWLWHKPHLAGMAGVMFAVHPVHTEAVSLTTHALARAEYVTDLERGNLASSKPIRVFNGESRFA